MFSGSKDTIKEATTSYEVQGIRKDTWTKSLRDAADPSLIWHNQQLLQPHWTQGCCTEELSAV